MLSIADRVQVPTQPRTRCPNCGRPVRSLRCGHCGSRLPSWQADLLGTAFKKIAKLGGNCPETTNKGDTPTGAADEELPKDDTPPKDSGDVSTPRWLFDRCNELAVAVCGEPITLDVAAADWNHKCDRYFTKEDDALTKVWDAKAAWCNSPYTAPIIESLVRKAIDESKRGTTTFCLVPSWNYPYHDLCEQHGRIHRICSPVTFQRQDGSPLTLNNGFRTTSLIVAVFGPTIQPGFGEPIRKHDSDNSGGDYVQNVPTPPSWHNFKRPFPDGLKSDEYYTPDYGFELLRPYLPKDITIWEGAWGTGQLAEHIKAAGYRVIGDPTWDFLTTQPDGWDLLCTNPPFSRKDEFLNRAYALGKPFAFLLPIEALGGGARNALFRQHGVGLIIPSKRIAFSGTACNFGTAWFCWKINLPAQLTFVEAWW
jgi:hypothetical protein